MLTREQIELIRAVLSDGTYTRLEQKDFNALCDMALRSLSEREAVIEECAKIVLGWRECDWPEDFDRRTAEIMAQDRARRIQALLIGDSK